MELLEIIYKAIEIVRNNEADVVISATAGLKSVFVQIVPDNEGFETALGAISQFANFSSGVEMIDNATVASLINTIAPEVKAPATGDTEYTFPVGSFFTTLSDLGATEGEGHKFHIVVTDSNDKEAEATLYVKNLSEGE